MLNWHWGQKVKTAVEIGASRLVFYMNSGILKTNFKSHLSLLLIAMIKCLSKWGACISNVFPTQSKIWSIGSELATYSNTLNSAQSQFQSFPGLQFVVTIPTQQSKPISTGCRSIAQCADPIFPDWLPIPLPCLAMPPLLLGHQSTAPRWEEDCTAGRFG